MSQIDPSVYIAPGAMVLGNVTIQANSSIWFHTTVRADRGNITIGENTNIQDNCVIHMDEGFPVVIGNGVTIGHGAIVHGCKIGDNTLIGMGAIILNGAVIGKNCIVGAGALITQNTIIPDGSLVIGNPGKISRNLSESEIEHNKLNALHYVKEAENYKNLLHIE